ncbi:MAG: hypothetical protein ACUVQG_12060, partial [Thermogutta sp.]
QAAALQSWRLPSCPDVPAGWASVTSAVSSTFHNANGSLAGQVINLMPTICQVRGLFGQEKEGLSCFAAGPAAPKNWHH